MRGPLLSVRDLRISLRREGRSLPIIQGLDLDVARGEIVGVAGESGSGKSMTGQALLNILPAQAEMSGSIVFDGRELMGLREGDWRRVRGNDIAMVFQDSASALHPMLTVGRQLTEHMRAHLRLGRAEAQRKAIDLLEQVRIPEPTAAMRSYPHQFSGGMRQRIAIAAALACDPRVLIADEPTTALDVTVQAGILRLFRRLCAERDLALIFITHDLGVLSSLADCTYVLYSGLVMESGQTGTMLTQPQHPYTHALLNARPHGIAEGRHLLPIPGVPAPAGTALTGCPFAPRCVYRVEQCEDGVPAIVTAEHDAQVRCVVRPDLRRVIR